MQKYLLFFNLCKKYHTFALFNKLSFNKFEYMKAFFFATKLYLAAVVRLIRIFFWNSLWRNSKQIHKLKVLATHDRFLFHNYGNIVEYLYAAQPMVRYNKGFEYSTLSLFEKNINNGGTIIDIGANIGLFSVLGSKLVGENGKVIAIEASKKTCDYLEKNLEINKINNAIPICVALSDNKGEVALKPPFEMENNQDAYNSMHYDIAINEENRKKFEVIETDLLDNILEKLNIKKVDLIKIDIEGAELLCFKGATKLLSNPNKPVIILESSEKYCNRFDYSTFDLLNFLSNFGYKLHQYEINQWIATPN